MIFIKILIERNYENIYRKLNLPYYTFFLLRFKIKSPLLSFKYEYVYTLVNASEQCVCFAIT